ncbi:MAG TPA: methionine adenosyltransferase [Actinomycetota bacterium]|nr:methionine adenosyltransferase [Actinomycetota bacterium]
MPRRYLFTSESVTEGHPDKLADRISDAVLDEILASDPYGRVACETFVTTGVVMVAGEISTNTYVDVPTIVRNEVKSVGYTRAKFGFDGETCGVITSIQEQSPDIAQGVDTALEQRAGEDPLGEAATDEFDKVGAGDQGMMFGYASNERDDIDTALMPLPIWLAHRMAEKLAEGRKSGQIPYLRPDGKTQVTIDYEDGRPVGIDTILISAQHQPEVDIETLLKPDLLEYVVRPTVPEALWSDDIRFLVNPTGRFEVGGPKADTGLTGRKIIVDTYGGMCAHGGGAFSGKDPTKVDRSGAYMARYAAKNLVASGVADRCEIRLAYAIGVSHPVSVSLEDRGTARVDPQKLEAFVQEFFDFRPAAIIHNLDLRRPIYKATSSYGHFGRPDKDSFSWERTDLAEKIAAAVRDL